MSDTTEDLKELAKLAASDSNVAVLEGAEGILTGENKYTLTVDLASSSGLATLMIPDITGVSQGKPVYVTKRIEISGAKLKKFLAGDPTATPPVPAKATLPPSVLGLVEDATISCEAFYYSKDTTLIMFALKFDKGVISSLIGADVADIFDLKGASVRILKCTEKNFPILEKYAAGLAD